MKAKKKPIIIDYLEVTGFADFIDELKEWTKSFGISYEDHFTNSFEEGLQVKTLEGTSYRITMNDVIIKGIKNEFYPCKKDIFEQTYDKINENT